MVFKLKSSFKSQILEVPTCKKFQSHHSCDYNKKARETENNNFAWTHQRTELAEQFESPATANEELAGDLFWLPRCGLRGKREA